MIYLLHGIVDCWQEGVESHRNYAPRMALEAHLSKRAHPYRPWSFVETDDVLTVDDATQGGVDACILARRLGHDVIFFVNPLQVATGLPYFFTALDAALDARTTRRVTTADRNYDLECASERRTFRRAVKADLMVMHPEDALAAVQQLSTALGTAQPEVAHHARPVSVQDLRSLYDLGVQIENHGWSHVEISALDDESFYDHVTRGREWLQRELGVRSTLYAPPFGLTDVTLSRQRWVGEAYLLADPRRPVGRIGPLGWNRGDLTEELQARS